jgi:spermidine/putrescine transport system substrate-binding protein
LDEVEGLKFFSNGLPQKDGGHFFKVCMMKNILFAGTLVLISSLPSFAAGELHIYNWGNYTNPKLIEKFEKQFDVKITLDSYDSNETMLAKVQEGNSGYDIAVPGESTVAIMIGEGLLEKTEPATMANFKNVDPKYMHPYWDDGRHYSVPWQFGLTAFSVDTGKYKGDINTYAILFDPPAELKGQINMLEDMPSVIHAAERYLGQPRCSSDKADLKRVSDLLEGAKLNWKTFSFDVLAKLTSHDVIVSQSWNGDSWRARQEVASLKFAYPKEGIEGFADNVVVLKGAPNLENAKAFQNFLMEPENAALISDFARFQNGILGSKQFMEKEFAAAPEINPPAGTPEAEFVPPCSPDVVEIYNKIWTKLKG